MIKKVTPASIWRHYRDGVNPLLAAAAILFTAECGNMSGKGSIFPSVCEIALSITSASR